MTQYEVPTLTVDIPELPVSSVHDPDMPNFDDLTFSEADKEKLDRASQLGRDLILAARAGSQQALLDLQHRMHITQWHVEAR